MIIAATHPAQQTWCRHTDASNCTPLCRCVILIVEPILPLGPSRRSHCSSPTAALVAVHIHRKGTMGIRQGGSHTLNFSVMAA